ncbi:MAG: serine/threonine-protein kinase [Minicystis sp.]
MRYRVVRPLGKGGMGAVYEVERVTDGQHLALKVILGNVSRERAARFAREAEIGARLSAPNLVAIVDVGVGGGGSPFLVMELVTGGSLEGRRDRFGDIAWALPILRQVARGLRALHEAGVVHRDLKPGNVLLDDHGNAKVSDFGIARFGRVAEDEIDPGGLTGDASPPRARGLTGTGAWMGTPLYMAPEAARGGRDLETPADVFAFGILAFEMLTGQSPFATPPVHLALANQPIPAPAALQAEGLDEAVSGVIAACFAADPAQRPDARRLGDALGA